jgi:hypothetical protein
MFEHQSWSVENGDGLGVSIIFHGLVYTQRGDAGVASYEKARKGGWVAWSRQSRVSHGIGNVGCIFSSARRRAPVISPLVSTHRSTSLTNMWHWCHSILRLCNRIPYREDDVCVHDIPIIQSCSRFIYLFILIFNLFLFPCTNEFWWNTFSLLNEIRDAKVLYLLIVLIEKKGKYVCTLVGATSREYEAHYTITWHDSNPTL